MSASKATNVQTYKDEFDDYLHSVIGLYAFAVSCAWDETARAMRPEAKWCIPRRMTVRDGDHAGKEVTPDGVTQVHGTYGVVSEMKKRFPDESPAEPFEQASKYARPLVGWWTSGETIASHDVVLLTHVATSVSASDAYKKWIEEGNSIGGPFAIVEFGYFPMGKMWLLLRRVAGQLSDRVHDEMLRQGKKLEEQLLVNLFAKSRFMENEPPLIYMMMHIYSHVLPLLATEQEYETETGAQHPVVVVTAHVVRESLEQQLSPLLMDARQFKLPKLTWVASTLEVFANIGVANRVPGSEQRYRFRLRPIRKDLLVYFSEKLQQFEKKQRAAKADEQPRFL